ncbi:formiminotetrahydrofolate cyclodeaminase [Diaminobutyricimonas aerilata]|uniref:Formiminotetrahydrofolate cyclodeaminase n=1 Tax=Diaminobutyricimonas aerilata TaxID=1162967 RepID=A0A2M9CHE1_9MICO|nr:cyclodeaminase/cyclohydrolase family protein [Diaminobutyricimonas aerilata]PJJ71275.1 formiminotetrahydrofolate cyclodeaminase [Diaminobutyricimonas aerilata]
MDVPSTGDSTVGEWMRRLAEPAGVPGGGAAVGVMLSIAAGLMSMVAAYTEADEPAERARALQRTALRLTDDDATVSGALGAAFRDHGDIRTASLDAARSSATLGEHACAAIADLEWLAEHGKPFLIADVAVATASLRGALAGARANLSYDLAALRSAGDDDAAIRTAHPALWDAADRFSEAIDRLDRLAAAIDDRAAPTSTHRPAAG